MKVTDFEWNKPQSQIVEEKTGGSEGQLFLANETKKLMDSYVPAQNLILAQNVRTYVERGTGIVHYTSPYAHYQYKGELYVSSVTGSPWASQGEYKVPTGRPLKHSGFRHPLATSEWDKAMLTARGDELTQAMQNYIDRGGK